MGAGANPAGAGSGGGNAKFDDDDKCPAPKKQQSKLDELVKPDLPLDAKQELLENPQLLELSIDPRNGQINK